MLKSMKTIKHRKDDLDAPKEINTAAENREAGQMQQRQVTETITREMPKINRNDTVTIKHVISGKTEEMKYKKAEALVASGAWVIV